MESSSASLPIISLFRRILFSDARPPPTRSGLPRRPAPRTSQVHCFDSLLFPSSTRPPVSRSLASRVRGFAKYHNPVSYQVAFYPPLPPPPTHLHPTPLPPHTPAPHPPPPPHTCTPPPSHPHTPAPHPPPPSPTRSWLLPTPCLTPTPDKKREKRAVKLCGLEPIHNQKLTDKSTHRHRNCETVGTHNTA